MVAITLALLGSLSTTSSHDARYDAGAPVLPPVSRAVHRKANAGSSPGAHLSLSARRPPASAAETALQTTLGRLMKMAGPQSGALVYDLSGNDELYALRPTVARPPASVEKLWTTVAVMTRLGPDTRFHTSVLGTGHQRGGVWHGDLYLRGGGDPTFGDQAFNHYWNHGYGPTANQLVAQLLAHHIHRVTGQIYADESLFDRHRGGLSTNLKPDVPDFGGQLSALTYDHGTTLPRYSPATFAAHELVLTMRGSGIAAHAAPRARTTPPAAHMLATVASPPLSVLTRLMDVPSDDLYAELLAKQLGVLFGRGGSIPAGAGVISQTIASSYGLHPVIKDGSGLSRGDRSSPLQIVELLRELWGTTTGRELAASLPTVGREGTVIGFGLKSAAVGNCVAKTGTLDYVTNLAGYCHRPGQHALAFALFIDGPPNGSSDVLESRMIAAIARY